MYEALGVVHDGLESIRQIRRPVRVLVRGGWVEPLGQKMRNIHLFISPNEFARVDDTEQIPYGIPVIVVKDKACLGLQKQVGPTPDVG